MTEFYIAKCELWLEAAQTAENLLKSKLVNLECSVERLTPGERKAVNAIKRKLRNFIAYAKCAGTL